MPVARSPMDKKGGEALSKYAKSVEKYVSGLTPWQTAARRTGNLRGKVEPGKVIVLLEPGEQADNPLFKDATTTRE